MPVAQALKAVGELADLERAGLELLDEAHHEATDRRLEARVVLFGLEQDQADGPVEREVGNGLSAVGRPLYIAIADRGSWYAKWYVGNRQAKRKIGAKRKRGSREGMTKAQAEKEMRRLMREVKPTSQERLMLREVGDAYIAHVRDFLERKPSTVQDYGGILNKAERGLPKKTTDRYDGADIEGYVSSMKKAGRSPKTISNHLNFLHGLFAFAEKRGWASGNAVAEAERPRANGTDPDIRFIDLEELEALLREVPDDVLGAVKRPLYLTAAMTGLRQGELVALRWKDVD